MSAVAQNNAARQLSRFPVAPGDTVTAWALSGISETYYPGETALAEDRVNYRFINGFVDVGDLPCRVAVWKDIAERTVELETDWAIESINLPGFNRRLEFSDFWHRPTRLKRWCKTVLEPAQDGDVPFRVATCGGVHIWVDGKLAAKFEPYSRNKEQRAEITLPLRSSGSEIIMLSEDMAERDTNWYVELTLLGDQPVTSAIPSSADSEVIRELMALARDVRPVGEFCTGNPLVLTFDEAPVSAVEISAQVLPSVHRRGTPPILSAKTVLEAGQKTVEIHGLGGMAEAYHPLNLVFSVGETRVFRQIAFALLRDLQPAHNNGSLKERKRAALRHAADHGDLRIGRALAILASGDGCTRLCRELIEYTLESVDERRDCSDFVLVPLLWLYGEYQDQLPADLAETVKTSILNYRYWVDEPGNDTMWFWSENHVLCFHVSQYLAGLLMPEEIFNTSGRLGSEQLALATERLGKWFDSVESHGFAEWNSAAYYPIDFIGLLALEHWGKGEIAKRADQLLTRLFKMISLHTLAGVPAGSMGRAYDKELRAGPCTELAPFATVAFGEGWLNEGVAALPMFCAGNYEPPADLMRLAIPEAGKSVEAHYVQGYGHAGRLALYKSATVQLSASVDSEPGSKGHQQHILDVRFAGHAFARAWVNHPGEDDPWGHQRPSYWAGNGTMPRVGQFGNAALMLFDIPETHRIGFTHAYAPADAFDASELHGDWLLLQSGRGYAALTPCKALEPVLNGPGQNREYRAEGRKAGWVVLVGDLADAQGLEAVRGMLSGVKTIFNPSEMTLTLERPDRPVLSLNYREGLTVGGKPHPFPHPDLEPKISFGAAAVLGSGATDNS